MATVSELPSPTWTVAKLRKHLGMIPAERIVLNPRPGTATEKDLVFMNDHGNRLCELVDGVLVEKAMGAKESLLAGLILTYINNFLEGHDLGIALGADGTLRLMPGLIRAPDVSFLSWARLPGGELPDKPIPDLVPDLAVEVISKSNTRKEMERKLQEYFSQGVRVVWLVYPKKRMIEVYISPEAKEEFHYQDTVEGGEVLPGFTLPLAQLFAPRRRKG